MSRRKQKFPSHIAGECDGETCHALREDFFSSVESHRFQERDSYTSCCMLPIQLPVNRSKLETRFINTNPMSSSTPLLTSGSTHKNESIVNGNSLDSELEARDTFLGHEDLLESKSRHFQDNFSRGRPSKFIKIDPSVKVHENASSESVNGVSKNLAGLSVVKSDPKVTSSFPKEYCHLSNYPVNQIEVSYPQYNLENKRVVANLTSAKDHSKSTISMNSLDGSQVPMFIKKSSSDSNGQREQCSGLFFTKTNFMNHSIKSLTVSSAENDKDLPETDVHSEKIHKSETTPFVCPVCQEGFKSKRSFNSHILVHCQLVKIPSTANKKELGANESYCESYFKRGSVEEISNDHTDSGFPLDLSCKRLDCLYISRPNSALANSTKMPAFDVDPRRRPSSPGVVQCPGDSDPPSSALCDRSPLEDENENLLNEARESEKAFFGGSSNETFLSEASTGLEPLPPLSLFHDKGSTRKIKVCSDDGPPMVYRVKLHAEQVLVSRILGINEETGDKMEMYKCFACGVAFASVSRVQAHLSTHKQLFVCRKCDVSVHSRAQFSQHVQKEHVSKENLHQPSDDVPEDANAENTVTVAALLSALHGNALERKPSFQTTNDEVKADPQAGNEEEEESRSDNSFPESPSSGGCDAVSEGVAGGTDAYKMFSCRFCGKKFDRAFSCNRHERVHTGFKPCFCRICGRGFSEPRNLRHHVIRFHSDGSLRHLIKRDRRKRKDEDSIHGQPMEVLRECGNTQDSERLGSLLMRAECTDSAMSCPPLKFELNEAHNSTRNFKLPEESQERIRNHFGTESINPCTENLAKLFAPTFDSFDNSSKTKKLEPVHSTQQEPKPIALAPFDDLEPGEIRLGFRAKIIDDDQKGRRLVVSDELSDEGPDHSPQFSSYAPRLNIVEEPVERDKALVPITDDIGRSFFECPYCLKLFGSTSDLNRHLDFHEDLRPYDCKYCEYSARTNSQLKVHKMRHEGIKQFICDVCNYNGVTQSDLNRHKKTQSHLARCQNVCAVCGLGFYSNSQTQVHITKCHPEIEGASSLLQMSMGVVPPLSAIPVTSLDERMTSSTTQPSESEGTQKALMSHGSTPLPDTNSAVNSTNTSSCSLGQDPDGSLQIDLSSEELRSAERGVAANTDDKNEA